MLKLCLHHTQPMSLPEWLISREFQHRILLGGKKKKRKIPYQNIIFSPCYWIFRHLNHTILLPEIIFTYICRISCGYWKFRVKKWDFSETSLVYRPGHLSASGLRSTEISHMHYHMSFYLFNISVHQRLLNTINQMFVQRTSKECRNWAATMATPKIIMTLNVSLQELKRQGFDEPSP